jgi:hypothetical protein
MFEGHCLFHVFRVSKNKMSAQKLWVAHVTSERTDGPARVSTQGCDYVTDFKVAIRRNPELFIPSKTPITLYQPDGVTQIDVGDSLTDYLDGNSRQNPLIVRSTLFENGILIYKVYILRRRLNQAKSGT